MTRAAETEGGILQGLRVGFVGRLAAMNRQQAFETVVAHGGDPTDRLDDSIDLLVVAGDEVPLNWHASDALDEELVNRAQQGHLRIIGEPELWQRLGLVEGDYEVRQLYTPAMLADLLQVPLPTVRRWQRRGLIVPARQVHRLAYFDFQEIATARRLAELLAAGVSPATIEKKLALWRRYLPQVQRPLSQLSIIVQGKDLLLRQGDGLIEAGGQRRFDFESGETSTAPPVIDHRDAELEPPTPADMIVAAEDLDDRGLLEPAAEMYRAAMAAGGPNAEICFRLAELLYRLGDLSAARERYHMALELEEDYVEARANLGCVLVEQGQLELGIAAFEGALACYDDYPDVHYQLARALDEVGRVAESRCHWETFLALAPNSPWADQACQRLDKPSIGRS